MLEPECTRPANNNKKLLVPCPGGCIETFYCSNSQCCLQDWISHKPSCQQIPFQLTSVDQTIVQESLVEEMEIEFQLSVLETEYRAVLAHLPFPMDDHDHDGDGNKKLDNNYSNNYPLYNGNPILTVSSATTPEQVLYLEAQELVRLLVDITTEQEEEPEHATNKTSNMRLLVALVQRLLQDDRHLLRILLFPPTTVLAAASVHANINNENNKTFDIENFLCDILHILLDNDCHFLEGKKRCIYQHSFGTAKILHPNASWYFPGIEAYLAILQAFPDETNSFQLEQQDICCLGCPATFTWFANLSENFVISQHRTMTYFRRYWRNHLSLCAKLLRTVYNKPNACSPHCQTQTIQLWYHLVVCLSHSQTAKAILWGLDQHLLHQRPNRDVKSYLMTYLRLFKFLASLSSKKRSNVDTDPLLQAVYQVAVLLVAQSRQLEQCGTASLSMGETFKLHTTKLETAFLSYCTQEQSRLWNELFWPWAMTVTEKGNVSGGNGTDETYQMI